MVLLRLCSCLDSRIGSPHPETGARAEVLMASLSWTRGRSMGRREVDGVLGTEEIESLDFRGIPITISPIASTFGRPTYPAALMTNVARVSRINSMSESRRV